MWKTHVQEQLRLQRQEEGALTFYFVGWKLERLEGTMLSFGQWTNGPRTRRALRLADKQRTEVKHQMSANASLTPLPPPSSSPLHVVRCPARSEPPRLEDCSPDGPVARHMAVEAVETEIDLGCFRRRRRRRAGSGTAAAGAAAPAAPAAADSGEVEQEYHRLLREPVDVTVSVKTVSPPSAAAAAAAADAGLGGEASGSRGGEAGEVPSPPPGSSSTGSGGDNAADAGEEAAGEEQKTMKVRVEVPRLLRLSLSADARAALARCVGGNILAAGFHGESSENFPLRAAAAPPEEQEEGGGAEETEADDMEYEGEGAPGRRTSQAGSHVAGASREAGESGLREGGAASAAAAAGRARSSVSAYGASPSPTRSPLRGAGGEESRCPLVSECPLCAGAFDELLARHECAWCGRTVCRRCMHTQVSSCFFFVLGPSAPKPA